MGITVATIYFLSPPDPPSSPISTTRETTTGFRLLGLGFGRNGKENGDYHRL